MRLVRTACSVVAALLFFVAGAQMREPGSGVEHAFGLLAYGAAFAVLAYGAGGARSDDRPPAPPTAPGRTHGEDQV